MQRPKARSTRDHGTRNLSIPIAWLAVLILVSLTILAACSSEGESTEKPAATGDGNAQSTESEDIEYMVRLLAEGEVREYWFLHLETIRSDPELAPLNQNLTETWNGWNKDFSDEFGVTLQDAAFAVSIPGDAVFLGGLKDVAALRDAVAGLGYEQQEERRVTYWINPDQSWETFIFLQSGVVMILNREPSYFLAGAGNFMNYEQWDEDSDWQRYLDGFSTGDSDSELDIGSSDDVVSDIRNSLMFKFEYRDNMQSMWAKSGADSLKETRTVGYPDDDSAEQAETEFREGLAKARADVERAKENNQGEETDEERYMREIFAACTELEADRSGNELTVTQVFSIDRFDFRYANYLLSVQ